ncbi:MAG TPA: fluoride efflux transporter CrcB [Burkholderiales bacterium]|nr:fluoride efflux transporter CrcB [Burkholderiales bacterium]
MREVLLVALGGALGSVGRYACGAAVLQYSVGWRFPAGTFLVNVLGCLVAGLLIGLAENYGFLTAQVRLLLFTGFLGGFTTFSAFGVETVALIQRGEVVVAGAYVVASVACGVLALWGAVKLGGMLG